MFLNLQMTVSFLFQYIHIHFTFDESVHCLMTRDEFDFSLLIIEGVANSVLCIASLLRGKASVNRFPLKFITQTKKIIYMIQLYTYYTVLTLLRLTQWFINLRKIIFTEAEENIIF